MKSTDKLLSFNGQVWAKMWDKTNAHILLGEMENDTITLSNWPHLLVVNIAIPYAPAFLFLGTHLKKCVNMFSKRNVSEIL